MINYENFLGVLSVTHSSLPGQAHARLSLSVTETNVNLTKRTHARALTHTYLEVKVSELTSFVP